MLLGPDWSINLDLVDMVKSRTDGPKSVCLAVRKRIKDGSPKQALLALTVIETCVKNCSFNVHNEVAQKEFMTVMCEVARGSKGREAQTQALALIQQWGIAFHSKREALPLFADRSAAASAAARARGAARSRFTMRARALCCRDPVTRSCSARAPTSLPSTTRWRPSSHRRPQGCSLRPAVRAAARPPRPRRGAVPRRRTSSRSCARTSARSRRRLRSAAKCFRTRRASRTTTRSPKLSDSSRSVRATLSAARARALAR